jgi:hypothetical protein
VVLLVYDNRIFRILLHYGFNQKYYVEAPLVHLSSQSDGQGWCIDMLGFLSNGKTVARCCKLSPVIVNGSIL